MKTIKPFIDLGWHTVPLKGKLERLDNGTKSVPVFEKGWKEKYKTHFNKQVSQLGGAITGECSNIIAVDCDNEKTYELFKSLDPEYPFIFESYGKGYPAATFVYKFDKDLPDSFIARDNDFSLDFYSNDGFVYLPTELNKTKVAWNGTIPELKELPATIKLLLCQLKKRYQRVDSTILYTKPQQATHLAPLLKQFVGGRGTFVPSLFRILTPKDFRREEEYVKYHFLHPDNVPEGRGSEYLSKVSAILGADESVDEELYMDCMIYINDLFSIPLAADRLDKTICTPMLEGNARIHDQPIWQFNKHWNDNRFSLTTKYGTILDLGFDKDRNVYYAFDLANESLTGFGKDTEFHSYLEAVVFDAPSKKEMKKKLPIVKVESSPNKSFGFCTSNEPQILGFNSFKSTAALNILREPDSYKAYYKKPETMLKYLETLIPHEASRQYLLGFIKRKLLTFEYSPVVFYFLGVQGSGKDTLVEILSKIMSGVSRPTPKEFLEVYNGWLIDAYFVQLDEYGDQLNSIQDKAAALGKLKAYTGKRTVEIRKMRNDGFSYQHNATFILTANKNPLMLEDGDRRLMLFETPNKLKHTDWFNAAVWDKMLDEIQDFCYYLATEVPMLSKDLYVEPLETEGKHKLIADSMYAAQKIAYAFKHKMFDYLKDLASIHGVSDLVKDLNEGHILDSSLEQLYDELTDFRGDIKSLRKVLRKEGFNSYPTTKGGRKLYIYKFDELNTFTPEED